MHDAGSREMRARDEAHEWAQTWSSQSAGEEKAGHVGFKVVIENGGTGNHLEICAQRGREIVEAGQVEAETGSGDDVIGGLGDLSTRGERSVGAGPHGSPDAELPRTWWPKSIGTLPSTRLVEPPGAGRTQKTQALLDILHVLR